MRGRMNSVTVQIKIKFWNQMLISGISCSISGTRWQSKNKLLHLKAIITVLELSLTNLKSIVIKSRFPCQVIFLKNFISVVGRSKWLKNTYTCIN